MEEETSYTSSTGKRTVDTYPSDPIKRIRGGGGAGNNNDDDLFDDIETSYFHEDKGDDDEKAMTSLFTKSQVNLWNRSVPRSLENTQDLDFQWMDVDLVDSSSNGVKLAQKRLFSSKTKGDNGIYPIIRFYGVSQDGNSICAHVHGFTPYAYFAIPEHTVVAEDKLAEIREELDDEIKSSLRSSEISEQHHNVISVALLDTKSSIMGYDNPHSKFLKIELRMPTMIPPLKRIMESGICLSGVTRTSTTWENNATSVSFPPFECNVPFILRYMVDQDITGACWITLPKKKFVARSADEKISRCQLEVDVWYDDVQPRTPEGEWSKIAPLRVLSMDIECQGRKGHFPEADRDPVIQIANVLTTYGRPDIPQIKTVFTLRGCLPIVGAQVICSAKEEELLLKWRAYLQLIDPDIITGYNVQNFDIPYLLDRGEALSKKKNVKKYLAPYFKWGRVCNAVTKMKESMFSSSAYGRRVNKETMIHGRVIFDVFPYMQRNHKLSSYTLNSVSAEFLDQQKEDVHHSIISDLQNGSDEDRHRLAVYCLKDALLPWNLMHKLSIFVNYIEMARVTGVPMEFLISRGQQIKVFSMILRKCRDEHLVVPTLARMAAPTTGGEDGEGGTGYEGATVLDPIKSYYNIPIATLDFASLYPSIMQAYNLCYSTMVNTQDVGKLDPSTYNKSENGNIFVKSDVKKGILPIILQDLLSARKQAKKDMKNATSEFEKAVQNGRQLALKVSANSVYGFTGANVGQLPCLAIAASVTSYGRMLLERTKDYVEQHYTIANGYKFNSTVIYGDTDSVMVKFGTETVADTFPLALEAAEKCSSIFPKPIQLEFEKVYFPYLLMNKKRYAGLMWTNIEKYDKMDTKGLESVRRDNCSLVREVIQTSLDKILIHQDVQGAIDYVKSQISDLLQNQIDISRLVITKSLNKGAEYALGLGGKKEDYKMKQAHVELAARMRKRDPGSAPQMGDRVPYVIITGAKGAANFEKSEDPIYVLENNLPIDCKWYLSNQLSKPVTRIFEPIIKNVERTLLEGDHTRKIFIPTPTARKGSLMMFASKRASCLGCKVLISDSSLGHICKHCKHKEAEVYLEKLDILREAELRYARLFSAAQRIHCTVHNDIKCTGDGCKCQFYRRKKAQADMRLALETMEKFGY